MLKRKIETKLDFWYNNRKQALLVTGARQVGKTHSIEHFIKKRFQSVIEIDFSKRTDLLDIFARLDNSNDLLVRLSLIAGKMMIPNKTVFFLDEIQLVYQRREEMVANGLISSTSQDIITAMKDMVQKGEYRFILSGSLLGILIKDVNLNSMNTLKEKRHSGGA